MVYSKLSKMSCQRKEKINCLVMIGFTNKQSMSFVILIICDSSNKPSHFLRHYPSGEGGWLFFIIYPFLHGLVLSQAIFFLQKNRLNRGKSGHFFTQKPRSNRREQKRVRLFGIQKFYHPANFELKRIKTVKAVPRV